VSTTMGGPMGPGMTPQMDTPTKDAKFSAMDSMMVCLEVYRSRLEQIKKKFQLNQRLINFVRCN
jgi:hypothetical protein